MTSVFFSYSHKDEALRDELEKHLTLLKRLGLIDAFHDRRIDVGDHVHNRISEELEQAGIVLLLVSSDFLASAYCYDIEMRRALERNQQDLCRVIPVILRPCDWHSSSFGHLLAAPTDGKAITLWANQDEAFLSVTKAIRQVLEKNKPQPTSIIQAALFPMAETTVISEPRSSNLRLKKTFTQKDRDDFLYSSFEYISRYFTNTMEELQKRHPDIQARYKAIDSECFTATIYQAGTQASTFSVFIGGFGSKNAIGYNTSNQGNRGTYNGTLYIEAGDHSLFLKPSGFMFQMSGQENNELSQQGAAECLWDELMRPLQ